MSSDYYGALAGEIAGAGAHQEHGCGWAGEWQCSICRGCPECCECEPEPLCDECGLIVCVCSDTAFRPTEGAG